MRPLETRFFFLLGSVNHVFHLLKKIPTTFSEPSKSEESKSVVRIFFRLRKIALIDQNLENEVVSFSDAPPVNTCK